jgi:predicted transport protein
VSLYSLLLIVIVSCVPNVVCVSVFSIIDCHCFLCAQCCLCLCFLSYWLSLFPVCPMLQITLGTQETMTINKIEYRDTDNIGHTGNSDNINNREYRDTDNIGPNVVCVSALFIIDCDCFLCAQCCLCLCIVYYWLWLFPVCPMLCVSLYSLLLIVIVSCVPNVVCVSVFSIIDIENTETQTTSGTQETVTINKREYRDTYNIGHTGNNDNQ